ncbi:hypothetical protein DPMN_146729 [Dreissena polymorpha]|uniref:Uncharacterized protein n=1 Tax=Dreissena polymorpha TaxID=45954 RepID=A0A9D4F737_DREPO|nr:hypothetical protein DPMN_146729 [Dreissena polymorpha]
MAPTKQKFMTSDDTPGRPTKGTQIPRRVLSPLPCTSGTNHKDYMEETESESACEGLSEVDFLRVQMSSARNVNLSA